jgi:hypothetical protein
MTEVVKVEQDDSFYWAAGSEFAEILVDELNSSLKENGITSAEQRQKICSQFMFGVGNFLDQYWMEVDGEKRYPVLCFTNKFLDIGVPVAEVEPLYLPVKDFEFHGAASDVTNEYFGTQGEQLSIRVGSVGEE